MFNQIYVLICSVDAEPVWLFREKNNTRAGGLEINFSRIWGTVCSHYFEAIMTPKLHATCLDISSFKLLYFVHLQTLIFQCGANDDVK